MAFGNGKGAKDWMRRSVEIGRVNLCALADGALHPLSVLRMQALPLSDAMAQAVWSPDPLSSCVEGKELHRALLGVQACSSLNSVWAESRRLVVAPAVSEAAKRRRRHLFGLLRHAVANTSEDVAAEVGPEGMDRVVAGLAAAPDRGLLATASMLGGPVIAALVKQADLKYGCPSWGRPRTAVTVALDHRSLRCGARPGYVGLLGVMTEALRAGRRWSGALMMASPEPRGAPIALPVVLSPSACRRALRGVSSGSAEVAAITVRIGERDAVVRAVLVHPKPVEASAARYVVARDFGYRNTAAFAVIDLGVVHALEPARAVASSLLGLETEEAKVAAKTRLEGHVAPGGAQVVEAQVWSGKGFLDRLHTLAGRIDVLRSEIDRVYARIGHLKATVNRALGVDVAALVPAVVAGLEVDAQRAHGRLFKLLEVVGRLKCKRLAIYRQADGVKRSWLGFVSNQEAALAARWGAAVVSEDLDVVAPEKGTLQYKGRTFNRMINAGCKGRYRKMASEKLSWMGVARFEVPSFYTSSTDVRHGVVDAKQRVRDRFTSRCDGLRMHADVHAAAVVGLWAFLVPKPELAADVVRDVVRRPLFHPCVVEAFGKGSPVL